ncbi:arylformamidase [Roseateles toxinivorans]|uniref:Kynurenine formamidase n=1 Tax=Roseateles toxinivorans TaxID=270368 RepID=A0A4R6QKP1_9BURK|nr:arylformamidase [Roseateles toxinivorans]TDP63129.1 kynurenine formamidase [Roseateles toxinivorans]
MKQLWDISPTVSPASPIFPGDEPYALRWTAQLSPGCPVNLSALTMSPHVGAHADAPLHYGNDQPSAAEVDLQAYVGPCRVIHAIDCGPLIQIEHVQHAEKDLPERVLVRCCRQASEVWNPEFTAYAPETVAWLAARGVKLIGLDTPSVDPADSKSLDSHQQLLRLNLRVLENLVLDAVPEGDYELIALPLKLAGACASPVRAVLRAI